MKKFLKENKIVLLFIVLLIIFLIINIVINQNIIKSNEQITNSLYTLTETTKEQVCKIPEDKEIKVYLFEYKEDDYVFEMAKKYEELNKGISIEIKSISDNEEMVNQFGIKEGEYNILIISGEKSKLFEDNDLYSYDYNTGDIKNLVEQRLTDGISQVSSDNEKNSVYILKGLKKYKLDRDLSGLKRFIELENYEIKELELSEEDISEDCKLIIIPALNVDLSDEETEKLKDYINNGGDIIWLEDAIFEEKEFNNANSILEMYGIEKEKSGVIFEQDKNKTVMQNPYIIFPDIMNSNIKMPSKVMFYYSSKLNFVNDEKLEELKVKKTELLSTSEKALFKEDLSEDTMIKKENDEEGKFIVGAMLEKSLEDGKASKLIIYANNYFVTNQTMTIGKEEIPVVDLYNNKELLQNSIDYIFENDNSIDIGKIVPRNYYIGIEDESVKQAIIVEIIIFIVLICVIIFIKKNKK